MGLVDISATRNPMRPLGFSMIRLKRAIYFRRFRRYLTFLLALVFVTIASIKYNVLMLHEESDPFEALKARWLSMNLTDIIRPEEETALIQPRDLPEACKTSVSDHNETPHLIITVSSAPGNRGARDAIRETWAEKSVLPSLVSVLFILGKSPDENMTKSIQVEARIHNDIIVEDFEDNYENLTIKTLFVVKWMMNNCARATHLLKTDDDMLIMVDNLLETLTRINLNINQEQKMEGIDSKDKNNNLGHYVLTKTKSLASSMPTVRSSKLKDINATGKFILGYLYKDPKPIRDRSSKWFIPCELYTKDYFPDFISGTAYVIAAGIDTYSTMMSILRNSLSARPVFPLEDVFITGVIANEGMGIQLLRGNDQFHKTEAIVLPWSINELATCFHYKSVAIHGLDAKEIVKGWRSIKGINKEKCNSMKGHFYTSLYSIIWAVIS
ncbi:beta-1,3-galactosyltransferase 1-like [Ischnura elegans]|uniref:beta-1,3-galactosyltransferase 1-like n=1 Tax=Ischnura elegans TaxID=197161 RepID=UPI001ED89EEC|nr:beta-1,3-galactosyltransferase 1-like [Ischnura elegans]XP_046405342.1 beta-1,3-galactosyltransferase 1-like [Ischnura elegans]